MAEAISIKKAVRRLNSALEIIRAGDEESLEPALRDFHQAIEEIREAWTPGELPGDDETIKEIVSSLSDLKSLNYEKFREVLDL